MKILPTVAVSRTAGSASSPRNGEQESGVSCSSWICWVTEQPKASRPSSETSLSAEALLHAAKAPAIRVQAARSGKRFRSRPVCVVLCTVSGMTVTLADAYLRRVVCVVDTILYRPVSNPAPRKAGCTLPSLPCWLYYGGAMNTTHFSHHEPIATFPTDRKSVV